MTPARLLLALLAGAALSAAAVNLTAPVRVIDGDTFAWGWRLRLEPARYRLAGIDAPETRGARCPEERSLGKAAAERLRRLLAGGGVVMATQVARDKYARGIASLSLGGHDLSDALIAEGLARPYTGRGRRLPWCAPTALSPR